MSARAPTSLGESAARVATTGRSRHAASPVGTAGASDQTAQGTAAIRSNFHFIVPVWGKKYMALFGEICLPLLLTSGNLRWFEGDETAQFVIATTLQDANDLRRTPAFERLSRLVNVQFLLVNGLIEFDDPHRAMSECYRLAMQRPAVVRGVTNFVFLTPDSFWSDGSFRRLYELSTQGYYAVMVVGLRLNMDTARAELAKCIEQAPDDPVIPHDQLLRLALAHLHQMSLAHDWLSNGFLNPWPSHIYWILDSDRMIARCFHLHPLLVRSPRRRVRIGTTIDGEFLARLPYPKRRFFVVQESSEIMGLELSAGERSWNIPLAAPDIRSVRRFAVRWANPLHWTFFRRQISFRADPSVPIPSEIEDLANRVARRVQPFRWLALPYHHLSNASRPARVLLRGGSAAARRLKRLGQAAARVIRR